MKINSFFGVLLAIIILGCSGDNEVEENVNLAPTNFEITIGQISDRSATITWTSSSDPENSNISYQIFLNNELIENNISQLIYTFNKLSYETNHTGKIVATDGIKKTTTDFSFKTQSFTPLIFDGNVALFSQQEVNDFGENTYNIITGTLNITSKTDDPVDIIDLSPLIDLMEVHDQVQIKYTQLTNFEGLNNLTQINNSLRIHDNNSLINFNGLEKIESIANNLHIFNNSLLEDIIGFNHVLSIVGGLNISYNPKLKDIDIFKSIDKIFYVAIYENESLESVSGFENITEVDLSVDINENQLLNNITAFAKLTTIGDGLFIQKSKITNLNFPNLETIGGPVMITDNQNLASLNGLEKLSTISGSVFYIWNNSSLIDFCGISSLIINDGVSGNISISGNSFDPSLSDFANENCSQ